MNAAITFVAYFNRAPQFITDDEIRFYLRYQSEIRQLKSGSMGIIHGMLKFLYAKTLRIERPVLDVFRCPKDTSEKIILSQGQVAKALQCVRDIRYLIIDTARVFWALFVEKSKILFSFLAAKIIKNRFLLVIFVSHPTSG